YADDTQLYAECSPSQHRDALLRNDDCVRELRQWLTNNKLLAECSPSQHRDALLRIDDCVRELREWLTNNKLLFNKDKTERITFRSSSVRSPTVGSVISVCGATIPLKMAVRDTGV
ncbi:hypothetical protein LSAT2_009323, partial [Lamellibrachia satsuma]